jgi:signal transduction histidine kinase
VTDPQPQRRSRLRVLSIAVLVVVSALAVGGCVATRQVVSDQEHKLLHQRTEEAGLYLSSALSSVEGTLGSLVAASAGKNGLRAFTSNATLATKVPNSFTTIALIRTDGGPHVVAFGGADLGDFGSIRAAAVQKAVNAQQGVSTLATTPSFGQPRSRRLGFAFASPALPGAAVYAEFAVHPEISSPATSGAPFSELVAAVYAGSRVSADQLLVSSVPLKDVPLRGAVARTKAKVGQDSWLLVAKARRPLVGSVAMATPWAILGGGLLAALLATGIVETLARRREYALDLVEQRTEELRRSMTDLAAAHEQLVRQERLAAIGQLASTIGHELRNPLGVISNAVYLLRKDFGTEPSEAASRHLVTAEREVSAATVIVSDLLEFARQRQPVLADVELVGLVDEVLMILPPAAGIDVERDVPSVGVVARADRDMLRQVLLNLIGNAYQAMPDGGRLVVGVTAFDSALQLRVQDSGTGMDDDTQARLFEPFFTTKARGVGLGLAVSKRIVEAHGGEISVDTQPGRGTEFRVLLPSIVGPRAAEPTVVREASR